MKALLSTTYFGPVQWYQKLYRHEEVQIEQWESFQKQTYRNRCLLASSALERFGECLWRVALFRLLSG